MVGQFSWHSQVYLKTERILKRDRKTHCSFFMLFPWVYIQGILQPIKRLSRCWFFMYLKIYSQPPSPSQLLSFSPFRKSIFQKQLSRSYGVRPLTAHCKGLKMVTEISWIQWMERLSGFCLLHLLRVSEEQARGKREVVTLVEWMPVRS